jgi:hypothetical protein
MLNRKKITIGLCQIFDLNETWCVGHGHAGRFRGQSIPAVLK